MLAVGGFRPSVVKNLKYRQVSVQLVRDPQTSEKRLIATFTLQQNKLAKFAIKTNQKDVYVSSIYTYLRVEMQVPAQTNVPYRVAFSITLIPHNLFCRASLAIARGLSDDAVWS